MGSSALSMVKPMCPLIVILASCFILAWTEPLRPWTGRPKPATWNPKNLDWRKLPGVEQNPAHTHANGREAFKPLPATIPWRVGPKDDLRRSVGQDYSLDSGTDVSRHYNYGDQESIDGPESEDDDDGEDYSNNQDIEEKPATWNPLNLDWRKLPGLVQNPPHTHANEKPTWEPIPATALPWKRSCWQDYDRNA
eukprot:TRINITY_DN13900_c0_g1_i1.p1 TRINITY_DN13900_c0_g1~~TRINITY_DN13900_c0_g1_i1.p1  ORF type:complete len:202 (-),score=40.91 TRINITY_DN13900_c0_g1_i1:101-682(-)